MTKLEELHKVKDQAMRALEKRNYPRAAELYLQIAEREVDPDWRQRAGDAFRRAGDTARAIDVLNQAAEAYAHGGFLLKAIAVSKTLLQLDPENSTTQAFLADLYARRDARSSPSKAAGAGAPMPVPLRPPGAALPAPVAAMPSAPIVLAPPPTRRSSTELRTLRDHDSVTSPVDLFGSSADRSQPIEVLALSRVLGGRRSDPFAASRAASTSSEFDDQPGTFEITLEDADLLVSEAEAVDEADLPSVSAETHVEVAPADEIDWSDVALEELRDVATTVAAPPSEPEMPQIPLFSSLPTADLLTVIQRMALHEVEPQQIVVKEGDRGGSLYVIVDGEVAVTVGQGVESRELARLGQGAFFGELGLLTDNPRSATVTATGPTRLLEISRDLAWEVIEHAPEVLRTLLRFFRDRMLDRLVDVSPLFGGLPREEAGKLASQFVFLEIETGVLPIKAGERSPGLYFLMCGAAEVVRDGGRIGTLGPGDVFGEMSMLLRSPATADVRTLRKTWVLHLPQAQFQEVMMTYPQVLAYVSELGDRRAQQAPPIESETSFASIDMGDSRRIEIA